MKSKAHAAKAPSVLYCVQRGAGSQSAAKQWPSRIDAAADLGADQLCFNPFLLSGDDPMLIADFMRADPALGLAGSADDAVRELAALCKKRDMALCVDLVLDRVALDGAAMGQVEGLFQALHQSEIIDPRLDPSIARSAVLRPGCVDALAAWWGERLARLVDAGAASFRLLGLELLPPGAVAAVVAAARRRATCSFLAWTPGLSWIRHRELAAAGVDAVFASTAWWDGIADWYVEELDSLCRTAPVIGTVQRAPSEVSSDIAARRRALQLAAGTTDGLFLAEGIEAGLEPDFRASIGRLRDRSSDRRMMAARRLTGSASRVTAVARLDAVDPRSASLGRVVLVNTDGERRRPVPVSLDPIDPAAGAVLGDPRLADGGMVPEFLEPGEVLMVDVKPCQAVRDPEAPPVSAATTLSPVVIDRVAPNVGEGLAVRRVVGRSITVEADIFADGHDLLAAELLWRAVDETEWQRAPMVPLANDRWRGSMIGRRVGRHVFTIEAWRDDYGSLAHALEVKHAAGVDVSVDMADAVAHLKELKLDGPLKALAAAEGEARVHVLTSAETRRAVAARDARVRACRHPEIIIEIERPQAAFASWYELFPRSLGTFDDVIAHLPRVREMGFDVLYFPPIHPIGTTNRKGRNNVLKAAPGDPGSPYAIGAADGGHDAIHAELGSPEDFRRLVAAAAAQGLEIALDFAIQCSPDHPWLKQHPGWFKRRSDGTIRFAENPPKKYEDIVNVDFYADAAVPDLWLALRDVVLHWIGEGVRIFRVDNPHTKPLPFWEWMIADVRRQHPEAIFLAEAFTRPAMMYRLGKIGFSQSYTYFTWRNYKGELTDYLRELAAPPAADFYRPHFFVNTPDINPYFLQSSGRAGFLIRAVLAATLSGLWGVYSGFEICEAAALPGREEYLDSEKYEARRRDFAQSGNIVGEITMLNRLRRLHPALQSHLGVTFYNAFNDQVLVYGKATPGSERQDMILVAVSLDPHNAQEADFEVPLWEWQMPDDGTVEVEDLVHGNRFSWHGKVQHIRLDPGMPFAIFRLAPPGAL
ncbi:alpha-1,4-glucan--maltose-1-phosphate maltosyltransferase [Reyranella sp.]|uniref:alpha-1,4-glucan--maltose-1-phosphate maltosyltransferase n=1 Tax=Reyranella sp. TaxID=1929291 RepID=UPI003BA8F7AA